MPLNNIFFWTMLLLAALLGLELLAACEGKAERERPLRKHGQQRPRRGHGAGLDAEAYRMKSVCPQPHKDVQVRPCQTPFRFYEIDHAARKQKAS